MEIQYSAFPCFPGSLPKHELLYIIIITTSAVSWVYRLSIFLFFFFEFIPPWHYVFKNMNI